MASPRSRHQMPPHPRCRDTHVSAHGAASTSMRLVSHYFARCRQLSIGIGVDQGRVFEHKKPFRALWAPQLRMLRRTRSLATAYVRLLGPPVSNGSCTTHSRWLVTSFLATVVTVTLCGFPALRRQSTKDLRLGLSSAATKAAWNTTRRRARRPPAMARLPRRVPLPRATGANLGPIRRQSDEGGSFFAGDRANPMRKCHDAR